MSSAVALSQVFEAGPWILMAISVVALLASGAKN